MLCSVEGMAVRTLGALGGQLDEQKKIYDDACGSRRQHDHVLLEHPVDSDVPAKPSGAFTAMPSTEQSISALPF